MVEHEHVPSADDFAEHEKTYRFFVKGVLLFAAHVLVVLLLLAWIFADRFGNVPLTG
jgi:Bacterial aa3 type cytochrome c oxidase subunit IV